MKTVSLSRQNGNIWRWWRSFLNTGGITFLLAGVLAMGFLVSLREYASLFQLACFATRNVISINGNNGSKL